MSEISFCKKEIGRNRLDTAFKRLTSRFERTLNWFGMILIDSSAQGSSSVVDEFMENNPYSDRTLTIRASRWEVREHMHYYGQHGWFKVFVGSSKLAPQIIDEAHPITSDMDPDRIIDVPEECRPDFEMNIVTAIQDLAGISTDSSDDFFQDKSIIQRAAVLPKLNDDIIKVDFDDKSDEIMSYVREAVDTIPKDRKLYIHIDLGVSSDNASIAISYMDHLETFGKDAGWNNNQKVVRMPVIYVPVAFAINRYKGQQTSIFHVEQFILELSKEFEIAVVEYDQYQSQQSIQNLTREGLNARRKSVFRTDEAAVVCKNLMSYDCVKLPYNDLMLTELGELKRQGNQVVPGERGGAKNSSKNATEEYANSHCDVAESVIGSVYACFMDGEEALQPSSIARINKQNSILRAQLNKDNQMQNLVSSIF